MPDADHLLPRNDDVARTKALIKCAILDTQPDEVFDQITQLATYICCAGIGFVGFIDSTRQWFKAKIGFNTQEVPRQESFCNETIRRRDLLLVPNATLDTRFCTLPLVALQGIRFYAGAPLITRDGHAVGTLAVMDVVPRDLRSPQALALTSLARILSAQLDRHSAEPAEHLVERQQALFEQNLAGYFRLLPNGQIVDCNTTFARMLGYASREEIIQRDLCTLFVSSSDQLSTIRQQASEGGVAQLEVQLRRKDGTPIWGLANVALSVDACGNPASIGGTVVDISQTKFTLQALQESQERLAGIVGSAMDAIITVDETQRIVLFNRAAEDIFRCHASEVLGKSIDKFIPQKYREAHRQHLQMFGETGVSTRSMESQSTLVGLRSDGEEFPIEATISQTQTASGKLYTVILRDVSARKRTENQLFQAHKMEAVGQLASGIAHEFNNYLGVILGYCELLAQATPENGPTQSDVAQIRSATLKAAALTRQLLVFSRKQLIEPLVLDLNAAVWDAHKLLRRIIPANMDLVPVLDREIGKIQADPGQIQQMLVSLVLNSRDAMPLGGKITIETSEIDLSDRSVSDRLQAVPGRYVVLSISDTGEGIEPENLGRIFEPFYSTKPEHKGTGLGLSTVKNIVSQLGGQITVASSKGAGTTFCVYLPQWIESIDHVAGEKGNGKEGDTVPCGTILLVEDDAALRRLIRVTLEGEGYDVLEARDGAEAWSLFETNPLGIRLIVTDIVMPRLTGLQLREKVLAESPGMSVLVITGYAEDSGDSLKQLANQGTLLEKPFLPIDLLKKVRALFGPIPAKLDHSEFGQDRSQAS